jgi:aryl-alcohol dehydrogenase-like predicted oxidoreductase
LSDTPLPAGASPGASKVKHLEENMNTADICPSAEDLQALNAS